MRTSLAIAVIVGAFGCKTDDAKPAPSVSSSPPRSSARLAAGPAKPHAELIESIVLHEPALAHATPLAPVKLMREHELERATQSWCMTGSDAQAIATEVASSLRTQGWTSVDVRGTADRAAASASIDELHLSITVGGLDHGCAGLVASAIYSTSTITIPPMADGERIR